MNRLDWVGPLLLSAEEVRRVPGGIPGIYMLHSIVPSYGSYATFYVGRASDIRRRLGQHMTVRSAKALISAVQLTHRCFWSAAPVEDERLLGAVESGLIRILRPICNSQVPKQCPVLVNLPPLQLMQSLY